MYPIQQIASLGSGDSIGSGVSIVGGRSGIPIV